MAQNPTQQQAYGQVANYNISPGTRGDGQSSALEVDSKGNLLISINKNFGLTLTNYDYVSLALTDSVTETYTFKIGGSGGTTTNTIVIVYTDSGKGTLSTVTKT